MMAEQQVKTKIFFASDFHLGAPNYQESLKRERLLVQWLDTIKAEAQTLYLIGDLFDFWFEYKYVVPKGHIRLLGKLAELSDSGTQLVIFTGNHDMWMKDYLVQELNAKIVSGFLQFTTGNHSFFLGHGDGIGPGDYGYKFLKVLFQNKVCQWLFSRLHPNFSFGLANFLSQISRKAHQEADKKFLGEDKEWLVTFSKQQLQNKHFDYFIFGHRHLPLEIKIADNATYVNLGDWMSHRTYAAYDGQELTLQYFKPKP